MPDKAPHGLIFQWLANEGRGLKLMVGIVATLMALTGFALLFQVVYPAARRHPLAVQRIVLLDGSTPESRSILDKVRDKDFLVLPPEPGATVPAEAKPPVFSPSFKDFALQPKDILESRANASTALPRVFRAARPLLPPVSVAPVAQARPIAAPQKLQVTVVEGLVERPMTRLARLDESRFAEIAGAEYRIAVAFDGRVTLMVPLSDPGNQTELYRDLRAALDALRFRPDAGRPVQWGTVALKWQIEKP